MATLDLRRSELRPIGTDGRFRFEVLEERRESSFWMPALMVADAARESEDERGEGEPGERWRGSVLAAGLRVWRGEPDNERDGGREFRSGISIAAALLEQRDDYSEYRVFLV